MESRDSVAIQHGQYYAKAVYRTEWDSGETVIESECVVNLLERRIVSISEERVIDSPYSEEDVDDFVELLDGQYVEFPNGETYPVVEDGMMDGYVDCGDEAVIPFELSDEPASDTFEDFIIKGGNK